MAYSKVKRTYGRRRVRVYRGYRKGTRMYGRKRPMRRSYGRRKSLYSSAYTRGMRRKIVQRFELSDDGTGTSANFGFVLDPTLPSVQACASLYEQVKISKIKIVVKPRYSQILGPIPKFITDYGSWEGDRAIIDGLLFSSTSEQVNQVINYAEASNYWSARKHSQIGKGWKRVWTPRVIRQDAYIDPFQGFDNGGFGYSTHKAPYFNVQNPALGAPTIRPTHLGWFVVFPAAEQGYPNPIKYDVWVTLYTSWKRQYFNDDVEVKPIIKPEPIN